jgi:hypothetical protein
MPHGVNILLQRFPNFYTFAHLLKRSRDSVVSIATAYELDDEGVGV